MIARILIGIFLLNNLVFQVALAAGAGSVKDLLIPVINVTLLFGFLFWKLKPKLVSGFQEWSNKIHKQYDGAEAKSKEAHLKLEVINKRYDDIENEKKKIMAEAEQQAAEFASVTLKEAKERTQKIAEETLLRSEAEKSKMLRELNAGILEKVIARTKSKIKTDSIVKSKTVKNLLQRIH